jgi:hypothetical protein
MKHYLKHILHDLHYFSKELYLGICLAISSFLSHYTDIKIALYAFVIISVLDTITRIHADATKKGLKFNPFKGYFWNEIKSGGVREMLRKVFMEYGIYLIIAFVIDVLVFKQEVTFEIHNRQMTLPVIALDLFSAIELWSIGENIEDAGGVNIFKRITQYLPEKFQKVINPDTPNNGE